MFEYNNLTKKEKFPKPDNKRHIVFLNTREMQIALLDNIQYIMVETKSRGLKNYFSFKGVFDISNSKFSFGLNIFVSKVMY